MRAYIIKSEVNDMPSLRLHLTSLASLALTRDLDVCHQRLIATCRNGICKCRFVSGDELVSARVHCDIIGACQKYKH